MTVGRDRERSKRERAIEITRKYTYSTCVFVRPLLSDFLPEVRPGKDYRYFSKVFQSRNLSINVSSAIPHLLAGVEEVIPGETELVVRSRETTQQLQLRCLGCEKAFATEGVYAW